MDLLAVVDWWLERSCNVESKIIAWCRNIKTHRYLSDGQWPCDAIQILNHAQHVVSLLPTRQNKWTWQRSTWPIMHSTDHHLCYTNNVNLVEGAVFKGYGQGMKNCTLINFRWTVVRYWLHVCSRLLMIFETGFTRKVQETQSILNMQGQSISNAQGKTSYPMYRIHCSQK